MLYYILFSLHTTYSGFNVFRYITFRAAMAALLALLVSFLTGPWLIRALTRKQIGQQIRDDGPASHSVKAGTPTMGGALILLALTLATFCWQTSPIPMCGSRCWALWASARWGFSMTI